MPQLRWNQVLGLHGVAVGIVGFLLVGVVCLGSIGYGVYQTVTKTGDAGSGQVLTVLGMYFSVPYLLIMAAFIVGIFDIRIFRSGASFWTTRTTVVVVALLFVVQQGFSNVYLVLLHGPASLAIVAADLVVLAMLCTWQLCPNTCVAYVLLFALKMGLVWGDAWKFAGEAVFGPSGFATMLFVCIPIIQMTLFSPTLENEGISQAFVSRFNIATTHLLHSLDIIAFFTFCFRPLTDVGDVRAAPTPLRWLMMVLALVAFCANNLGVPLLFFRQAFRRLELPSSAATMMDAAQSSASYRDFRALGGASSGGGGGGGGRAGSVPMHADAEGGDGSSLPRADASDSAFGFGSGGPADGARLLSQQRPLHGGAGGEGEGVGGGGGGGGQSENEQMLTFMLIMLMLCDFPFLVTRLSLWAGRMDRVDVFAAKNIKAMIDVMMLLTRTRTSD